MRCICHLRGSSKLTCVYMWGWCQAAVDAGSRHPPGGPRTVCANDQLRDPQRERRRGTEGAGEPPGDWSWHAPDRGWLKGQALCSCFAGSLVSAPTLVWLISPLPLAVWGDKVLTDGTVGTVVRLVRAFEPGL